MICIADTAAAAIHDGLLPIVILLGVLGAIKIAVDQWIRSKQRERRRTYYRDDYLKSDNWKRKRVLVLRRDGYRRVYCGSRATQVHHKKYAPRNIGREPIEWLVSVCDGCHRKHHEER
jgi:5-methylcytosine-specific restriction endonuclease McrA